MIELTAALDATRRSGNEERAECLTEVPDLLAEGIYVYEHRAGQDMEEKRLDRAMTAIRTCYHLKSGIPRADALGTGGIREGPGKSTGAVGHRWGRTFANKDLHLLLSWLNRGALAIGRRRGRGN